MTTELPGQTAPIIGAARGTGRARPVTNHATTPPGMAVRLAEEVSVELRAQRPRTAGGTGYPRLRGLDPDSARWLQALADDGPRRESALAELYASALGGHAEGCQFRGESRFTMPLDAESWDRLPDRFGFDPHRNRSGGICSPRCAVPSTPN
jgi:hypothetical protein